MNREKQVTTSSLNDQQHAEPPRFMLFALLREKLPHPDAVAPPPDGGLQAWTQVAVAHLILFCTWGFINSFGFFQAYYEENLGSGVSGSRVSWIASVQVFLLSFIGSFSGRLMDAGYYRYCLIGGFTFQIIGIFMISLCKQYWQVFLAQGLCCGLGDGLLFCPTTALIATYFVKKRRAIALGLTLSGSSTGGLIFPILVQQLLPKIGFRWTIRCMGFVVLFCFIICLSLARPRLPRKAVTSAPLVEPSAFRELPYSLFVVGIFLTLWAVYFSYFYVSLPVYCAADAPPLYLFACSLVPIYVTPLNTFCHPSLRHLAKHRLHTTHTLLLTNSRPLIQPLPYETQQLTLITD
jgi:MFS family permease